MEELRGMGGKFVVDFGEVPLPREMARRLDREIRRTTLQVLAELDLRGDEELRLRFPKEWFGIFPILDRQVLDRVRGPGG